MGSYLLGERERECGRDSVALVHISESDSAGLRVSCRHGGNVRKPSFQELQAVLEGKEEERSGSLRGTPVSQWLQPGEVQEGCATASGLGIVC